MREQKQTFIKCFLETTHFTFASLFQLLSLSAGVVPSFRRAGKCFEYREAR